MPADARTDLQRLRDYHQSGMNPDSRLEPGKRFSVNVRVERAQLLEQRQRGANGALGFVFVCCGITEVDEDPVAENLSDGLIGPFSGRQLLGPARQSQ